MLNIRSILNEGIRTNIRTEEKNLSYFYLLEYIKKNCKLYEVEIESNIRLEYIGDFYGLLLFINTNPKLLYINTLLNGLSSSNEYDGMKTTLVYVNTDDPKIESIIRRLNIDIDQ